jgi:thymidine kinase
MERVRRGTDVVAIDEMQVLDYGICVVNALADINIHVNMAGTDMDFRNDPLGPTNKLLAMGNRLRDVYRPAHQTSTRRGDSRST